MKFAYGLVFFDVDSTLVALEGIDVLAGGDPRIARLTDDAMNGRLPLEEVYGRRLEIIRPHRDAVEALGETYVTSLVAGAEQAITTLREGRVDVHLISAGLEPAILRVARHLGVAPRAVHAVGVDFDASGDYRDFDRRSPLTRTGGKELVIRDLRARSKSKVAMIGDGVSDLETRPAVDLFIGFGGVCVREAVRTAADVFIEEPDIMAVLPHLGERS